MELFVAPTEVKKQTIYELKPHRGKKKNTLCKGAFNLSGSQKDRHRSTSGAKECFSSIGRFGKKEPIL